jgi:hypothetical protein
MSPKGKQRLIVKLLPLKDGNTSGNLGKPPDDATKLASLSSHRESEVIMPKKTQHCRNDDDVSNVRQTSDVEPKSSNKNSTGLEEAQEEQSDVDVDMSEMSDAFQPSMSQSQKHPEVTIRTDHSDINKLVITISNLTTTINESRESELKSRKTNDDIAKANASIVKMNVDIVKASKKLCLNCVNSLRCKLVRLANASKQSLMA